MLPKQYYYEPNLQDEDYSALYTVENLPWGNQNIYALGIQGPPGLKFTLNADTDWIMIGPSGIYETQIIKTSLSGNNFYFNEETIDSLLKSNPNSYLLIDCYYYPIDDQEE